MTLNAMKIFSDEGAVAVDPSTLWNVIFALQPEYIVSGIIYTLVTKDKRL